MTGRDRRLGERKGHDLEIVGNALRCRVCAWTWERIAPERLGRCPGVRRYRAGSEPKHLLTGSELRHGGWPVPPPVACRNPDGDSGMHTPVYLHDPEDARALARSYREMWGKIVAALCREWPADSRDGTPITPERIARRDRNQDVALLRQIAYLLLSEHVGDSASCTLIGRCAGRDHATVLWGIDAARRKMERDPGARRTYEDVKAELGIGRGVPGPPGRDRAPEPQTTQPTTHRRTPLQEYERRAALRRQQMLRYA